MIDCFLSNGISRVGKSALEILRLTELLGDAEQLVRQTIRVTFSFDDIEQSHGHTHQCGW